jgi:hypothetical protein
MNELPNPDRFALLTEAEKAATPAVEDRDDETARIAKARSIIAESVPIAGTPAAIYLRSRGVDPVALPRGVNGLARALRRYRVRREGRRRIDLGLPARVP